MLHRLFFSKNPKRMYFPLRVKVELREKHTGKFTELKTETLEQLKN